jgi:hypothetical protein
MFPPAGDDDGDPEPGPPRTPARNRAHAIALGVRAREIRLDLGDGRR